MIFEIARTIVATGFAIGLIAWLAGVAALARAAASTPGAAPESDPGFGAPGGFNPGADEVGAAPAERIAGAIEVEGHPAGLADRAAATLAAMGREGFGPVRVLSRTDHRVDFVGLHRSGGSASAWVVRGQLRLEPAAEHGRTRVEYAVDPATSKLLLRFGAGISAVGLAILVGLSWGLWTYVADSPNPGVRAQSVQIIRVMHALWPPFLLAWLHRSRQASLRGLVDGLVGNLPYSLPHGGARP
jgi:hypothetical protein